MLNTLNITDLQEYTKSVSNQIGYNIPPQKKRRETIKCNAIVSLERKMSSRSTQKGNNKRNTYKKTQGVRRKHARSI